MDLEEFVAKLERYVGEKITCDIVDNALKVYVDNEAIIVFDLYEAKIDMYERNAKTSIGRWSAEKFAKINFAMLMRNIFRESGSNAISSELTECNNLEKLNYVAHMYIDEKYYSIGSLQVGKISIVLNENYKIIYKTSGKEYRIEESMDRKYIFSRYIHESFYFALFMKNLEDYTAMFDETFSEIEVVELLGY